MTRIIATPNKLTGTILPEVIDNGMPMKSSATVTASTRTMRTAVAA